MKKRTNKQDEQAKQVWVAIIEHRNGTSAYLAKTEEALISKVRKEFVNSWWDEQYFPGGPIPKDDRKAVEAYFEDNEDESMTVGQADLD